MAVTTTSVTQAGLAKKHISVSHRVNTNREDKEKAVSCCADSPRPGSDLEQDEVPAVKDGNDDEEDQEQETDEEHQRLDHHPCPHRIHERIVLGVRWSTLDTDCNSRVPYCYFDLNVGTVFVSKNRGPHIYGSLKCGWCRVGSGALV